MSSWVTCALFGLLCAADPVMAETPPDTSAIISVIGRFSMAHACPVGPDLVLTNSHVLDARPFDASAPLSWYRFSVGNQSGVFEPLVVSRSEDLGAGLTRTVLRYYPISSRVPQVGERLWWVGYDWTSRNKMFQEKLFTGKVLRVVAGNVVIDQETPEGSSGSCILNAAGEAVAVVAWGVGGNNQAVTVGVGLYGDWVKGFVDAVEELKKPKPELIP